MEQHNMSSIEACASHDGDQAEEMRRYLVEGEQAAYKLDNRGPIRFAPDGRLADDILDA